MLVRLVTFLGKVGLKFHAAKTKILISQAQPPKTLTTRAGLDIEALDQSLSHKRADRKAILTRAFHVSKWVLDDKTVSWGSMVVHEQAFVQCSLDMFRS